MLHRVGGACGHSGAGLQDECPEGFVLHMIEGLADVGREQQGVADVTLGVGFEGALEFVGQVDAGRGDASEFHQVEDGQQQEGFVWGHKASEARGVERGEAVSVICVVLAFHDIALFADKDRGFGGIVQI